jgi:LysR family transcriptional regulator, low CO2-responsive transcriptional regulator
MRGATLKQLRAFCAAARHHSFARAAEELHLTPPAVTMQIKELESVVGLPLFDRGAKTVTLTMSGEYLLVYVRRMMALMKDAEDAMARLRGAETGRITIGMVSTAKYYLPRLLAKFRAQHRGVEMRLSVGNREQLVRQLHDNEVDLAVMGRPPRELDTRAEPFAAHPHGVLASPEHPLAGLRGIPPSALATEEFIVREPGSGTRAAMEQFFREHRLTPPFVMEMAGNETIKQAVIANMGLAFLSLHTAGLEISTGQLVVLDVVGLPLVRRWHIVNVRGKPLSPAAEALRYFVLEQGEALIARQFAGIVPAEAAAQ